MWKWLSPWFVFTTNERRTIILLLFFSSIAIVAPRCYTYFIAPAETRGFAASDTAVVAFMKEYEQNRLIRLAEDTSGVDNRYEPIFDSAKRYSRPMEGKSPIVYFAFDPNSIGEEEWMKLGLSAKQAAVVANYRAKGGKFRTAEDIRKIKVISAQKADELIPFISISKTNEVSQWANNSKPTFAEKPKQMVDINLADSTAFDMMRGIGPSLARRIVLHRERMGGFVAVRQIGEVWGFPDSTYQSLKDRFVITSTAIRKLNVNTADVTQMKTHPYFNYYHAKAIVVYRTANGAFKKTEDLKDVHTITDSIYQVLLPYITLE